MGARVWLVAGAVCGALSVAFGAFGAHALWARLDAGALATFETGARYQMYHALALLAVGCLAARQPSGATDTAGLAFVVGIILFSGSLYLMTLLGIRALGAITPLGGVAFLVGWIALAAAAARQAP